MEPILKATKRNMDIEIGMIKANINLYDNIHIEEVSYKVNEDNTILINDEYAKPSFMIMDMLSVASYTKIKSFIEINNIELKNNILGYEFYSEKDINRVLSVIKSMAEVAIIRLGFLNEQTNEIEGYPNIDMIYEHIVPTYKKYGFVDVSNKIGGYESSVVLGIGDKVNLIYKPNKKEPDSNDNENKEDNYYVCKLYERPLDIPYIAVFKASSINEALLKIVKKNGYKNFTVKNLNGKVLKQTKLEGVNHTKYNEYIDFKTTLFDLKFDYTKTIHIEIMEMPKEDNDFSIIQEFYREDY